LHSAKRVTLSDIEGQIKDEYYICPDNKLEFCLNNETYEVVPINKINNKLDEILANPATALRGRVWLYMRVCDTILVGISRPAMEKYLAGNETAQLHQPMQCPTLQTP